MPIGLTEEHEALRQAVRRFVDTNIPPAAAREALDAPTESLPKFWDALAEPGWLGLHVAEAHGGAGYGFVEQAVVIEELGRAVAPGPYVPTALAAAILEAAGGAAAAKWLPQLVAGAETGAVSLGGPDAIVGAVGAAVVIVEVDDAWCALATADLDLTECKSVDPTRRVARVELSGVTATAEQRLDITTARV